MPEGVPANPSLNLLSLVLESLPVGVWIMDRSRRITHGNPKGRRIWSGARYVGPEDFGEYKGWWAETGERIKADEWAAARAIQKGETSVDEVIDIECLDGSRKTIPDTALPLRDAQGAIVGAIIINQDISDRRRKGEPFGRAVQSRTVRTASPVYTRARRRT